MAAMPFLCNGTFTLPEQSPDSWFVERGCVQNLINLLKNEKFKQILKKDLEKFKFKQISRFSISQSDNGENLMLTTICKLELKKQLIPTSFSFLAIRLCSDRQNTSLFHRIEAQKQGLAFYARMSAIPCNDIIACLVPNATFSRQDFEI